MPSTRSGPDRITLTAAGIALTSAALYIGAGCLAAAGSPIPETIADLLHTLCVAGLVTAVVHHHAMPDAAEYARGYADGLSRRDPAPYGDPVHLRAVE